MQVEVPKHPTHAVRLIDNWDGERQAVTVFAFKVSDHYHDWENGKPLLEYEGDEILAVWDLGPQSIIGVNQHDAVQNSFNDDSGAASEQSGQNEAHSYLTSILTGTTHPAMTDHLRQGLDEQTRGNQEATSELAQSLFTIEQLQWCESYKVNTGIPPLMDDFIAGNESFVAAARRSISWYEDHTRDMLLAISKKTPGLLDDISS